MSSPCVGSPSARGISQVIDTDYFGEQYEALGTYDEAAWAQIACQRDYYSAFDATCGGYATDASPPQAAWRPVPAAGAIAPAPALACQAPPAPDVAQQSMFQSFLDLDCMDGISDASPSFDADDEAEPEAEVQCSPTPSQPIEMRFAPPGPVGRMPRARQNAPIVRGRRQINVPPGQVAMSLAPLINTRIGQQVLSLGRRVWYWAHNELAVTIFTPQDAPAMALAVSGAINNMRCGAFCHRSPTLKMLAVANVHRLNIALQRADAPCIVPVAPPEDWGYPNQRRVPHFLRQGFRSPYSEPALVG